MPMDGQKMKNKIRNTKGREWLLSLLFPSRCPVCDEILAPEENEKGIHLSCESRLYPVCGAVCMHCGRPFRKYLRKNPEKPRDEYFDNCSKEFCAECTKRGYVRKDYRMQKSSIRMGMALYVYKGDIKQSMYRFKYSNKREYATFFARKAVETYPDLFVHKAVDAIVPVPMYMPKQKKRGYNQAAVFAKALSEITGIPADIHLIQRIKDTTPQKQLDDLERKNNLKNAFQNEKSIVEYNKVLVVDDIYTTGSTVEAVAEELEHIGIGQIYVLTICIGGES